MVVQRSTRPSGNGQAEHGRAKTKPPNSVQRPTYSLGDTKRIGMRYVMRTPTFVLGVGSAGSRVVFYLAELILRELGFLPTALAYLGLDADANFPPKHRDNAFDFGVDGAGTDATKGREMFLAKAHEIVDVLTSHFLPLLETDPRFSTELTAREATAIHVIAGCGGSSGGAEQPAINLCHAVARRLSGQEIRIYLHHIAPDVPLADLSHSTSPEQNEIVQATFASNLSELFSDYALDELRTIARDDGRPLSLPSRDRVMAHTLTARTNGQVDCLTSDETEKKLAWALFQGLMTPSGMHQDSRRCDERGYDAPFGFAR